ncbi:MAG: 2-hydroxyacid dehydrogenase [Bifidobacteriaceae bacterium]|jgi:D-3-phosphoglycerate dehydrogenase|nr:2-hydroxyacid dehydrogenase [Bifidobacteriaceae bacterium]
MKVLAIADMLIGPATMAAGLATAPELAEDLTVREWTHESLASLQEDNLAVEQRGPDAVPVPAGLLDDIVQFDVLVTQFCPVAASVIRAGTKLRAIGVLRAGVENVDVGAAEAAGITVVNSPGRNANAVAEFTVGLILAETRNIARAHAEVMAQDWSRRFRNKDAIPELKGHRVGLVGLGQIGLIVAGILEAFGMEVVYFDPYVPDAPYRSYEDLAAMASAVDILSLHSRLTPATKKMVSAAVIAALPEHAVLVNTARSGLVDEPALIEALRDHRIMGAAIDTFDIEPLPPDSPFLQLDNVTLTSHLAGTTVDAISGTPRLLAPRLAAALRS